jgi:hypothetical protein
MEPIAENAWKLLMAWLNGRGAEDGRAWTFDHGSVKEVPAGWYVVVKVELVELGGEPKGAK